MFIILVSYLLASVVIGILDAVRIHDQSSYLSSFPVGDIGYYVKPECIIGVHNLLFLPSMLIIGLFVGVSRSNR